MFLSVQAKRWAHCVLPITVIQVCKRGLRGSAKIAVTHKWLLAACTTNLLPSDTVTKRSRKEWPAHLFIPSSLYFPKVVTPFPLHEFTGPGFNCTTERQLRDSIQMELPNSYCAQHDTNLPSPKYKEKADTQEGVCKLSHNKPVGSAACLSPVWAISPCLWSLPLAVWSWRSCRPSQTDLPSSQLIHSSDYPLLPKLLRLAAHAQTFPQSLQKNQL